MTGVTRQASRVAVTGAGGLLGRAILSAIRRPGRDVVALSSTAPASKAGEVVRWTADDPWERTADALEGVDVLVHSAARIPTDHNDPGEAARCVEVNAGGTLKLLQASVKANVSRFILISGANALRARNELVEEDDPVGCEHSPYYLGSKVLAEIYLRGFMAHGLSGLILRPTSIYGPGLDKGVLHTFADRLRRGAPIVLKDGGRFRADYVWRDDVASVVARALESPYTGAVNIGSGAATALTDVAGMLCGVLGADPGLIVLEPPVSGQPPGGFAAVDLSRARAWFGFSPIPLAEGLQRWFGPSTQ